ncbi:MAG: redoxin domain-containing protein, partial [Planctomycetota bacterium]
RADYWFPALFGGKIAALSGSDERLTIETEGEYEPNFLLFQKTEQGYLFAGLDEERYMEWMDQPHELIPNIALEGETVEGEKVSLAELEGKVVLIDFWGTWCGPCVAEIPVLKKIHGALNDKGFEIIGVAADDPGSLRRFLKKNDMPWPSIVDADGDYSDRFKINAYPTFLLVNAKGEHYASDLFGGELLDEIIGQLGLDPQNYAKLRTELEEESVVGGGAAMPDEPVAPHGLPIGFAAADADGNGAVTNKEMKSYLEARVPEKMPYKKIFDRIDKDQSKSISEEEFENRHEAIEHFMGDDFFGGMPEPNDPGKDFKPVPDLRSPIDDRKVMGAVFHRYYETIESEGIVWPEVNLDEVPTAVAKQAPWKNNDAGNTPLMDVYKATVVLAGGDDDFFTSGAVIISADGLALTNYHVAEAMSNSHLVALTHDGTACPVVEFIAGDVNRDVALIRLQGNDFTSVRIAAQTPEIGSDLRMVHHSENRFYTYDRGYTMRYPVIGELPWFEVSMDYAPGGSGCGIFNENHELVGLVSTIQFGDGPTIAEPFTDLIEDEGDMQGEPNEMDPSMFEEALIMVKHAVSLPSIQSLWK